MVLKNFIYKSWISSPCGPNHFRKSHFVGQEQAILGQTCSLVRKPIFCPKTNKLRSEKLCNKTCLTIPSLFSRYDSSSISVFAFLRKIRRRPNNSGIWPGPHPHRAQGKIRRSGKPLPPIIYL